MSQISPPLRFLLVGSVLFLVAYMVFLRPGGGTETATTAPPATTPAASSTPASAPGRVVQHARDAAATAERNDAASAGEAPATATAPRTSAPAGAGSAHAPASATAPTGKVHTKGLPADVARAVHAHKVLVLLFWNPKAADDRAVRDAVRHVDRFGGKVVVHVADVDHIARYASIAQGVDVQQSPSVVVVDGKRRATLLTGYVDLATIEQQVADALGINAFIAAKPVNGYFRSVDRLCAKAGDALDASGVRTPGQFADLVAKGAAVSAVYDKKFLALDTPKRYAAFRKGFAAENAKASSMLRVAAVEARSAKTPADVQAVARRIATFGSRQDLRTAERFGKYGIAHCFS